MTINYSKVRNYHELTFIYFIKVNLGQKLVIIIKLFINKIIKKDLIADVFFFHAKAALHACNVHV